MLVLLAASFRNQPPPAIPQLSVEAATRLSSALHALSTPGGPLVLSLPSPLPPHSLSSPLPLLSLPCLAAYLTTAQMNPAVSHGQCASQRARSRRRPEPRRFLGKAHRVPLISLAASVSVVSQVCDNFLFLQQHRQNDSFLVVDCRIITPFSLGRWAFSSASAAAFRVLGFIARTLRIQAPAGAASAGQGKQDGSDHA
jgi:hypothetical protein